jgi:hypothetical protein
MPRGPKWQLANTLNLVLANDDSQALREQVAQKVPAALASNGLRLLIHHELDQSAAGVGFAAATLTAGELGEGAQRLYGAGLWYPGAALVRQLIEAGYLLMLMSESREEAGAWMRSSHDEIIKRFMPSHLRQRAVRRFRPAEYEKHCDLGGHPNPAGRILLRSSADHQLVSTRSHWLDLAQHLSDAWESFVAALPLYDPRMQAGDPLYGPERSPESSASIESLLAEWREADRAALTASIPDLASQST